MDSTNKQRQVRFAENQRRDGKRKISVWATPEDATLIAALLQARNVKNAGPLVGSESQVRWAADIRSRWIADIKSKRLNSPQLEVVLRCISEAHWWIESRGLSLSGLLEKAQLVLAERPPPYLFNAALATQIDVEATLFPQNRKTNYIGVDVCLDGELITLIGSEFSPKLTSFAKANGFKWGMPKWAKNALDLETVTAMEQAVAVAVDLLDAGFTLKIFNETLRSRVIAHDYQPVPARTIDVCQSEKYGWQFRLSWRGALYHGTINAIGELLEGKVFDSAIYCRMSRYETIIDVARIHGFVLTNKAIAAIAEQKEKHLMRLGLAVVVSPKREHTDGINPLAVTPAGIDEALLDV